ncbi:DUF4817 domain-containing protein [Trichonephila clavipes]|nr:DUF4817 domain-containing protein [Trichonephila clavipes]
MVSAIEIRERRQNLMPLNFPVEDNHLIVQLIDCAVQRLYKTGSCHRRIPLSHPTPSSLRILAEDVLGYVLTLPECSVQDISKACSYSKSTMWVHILIVQFWCRNKCPETRSVVLIFAISC